MNEPTKPAQTKALAPIDAFRGDLSKMEGQFKAALPEHISPAKFVRVVVTAVQNKPELLNCNKASLFGSCMKAAQVGLLPDGREASIIPYGDVATYLPQVAGICKKARNSGEIKEIDAAVVYENDFYEAWTDEKGAHFKHVKARGDRGGPILTYAYATTRDGGFFLEEVDEAQMASIEASSKAKSGPWKGPFRDEMKRKSAIKRLAKYRLPSSTDLEDAIKSDNEEVGFSDQPPQSESPTTSGRVRKIVEAATVKPEAKAADVPTGVPDDVPI